HLRDQILSFWMPRCLDKEYGGYLNCFDNSGKNLLSNNKFTWSQGRFIWIFSRLSNIEADIFTVAERKIFQEYAANGADFLKQHVLLKDKHACTYLMDRMGRPIYVDPLNKIYDASIYADFFAICGFARYSMLSNDTTYFEFALELYQSAIRRIQAHEYRVLPYVRPSGRRMHGIPLEENFIFLRFYLHCNFSVPPN
ncbi:MAG: AGE family epimerase/isomerase, partial [Spirochaetota bacterium]